jgi:hypothetical protein
MMDIVAALKSEEKKLETRLGGIRQAIHALNGTGSTSVRSMASKVRGHKLKGRKLSAAHVRAIKMGIAKAKARKAGSK